MTICVKIKMCELKSFETRNPFHRYVANFSLFSIASSLSIFCFSDMSESETVWARGGKRFQLLWIPVIVQNSNPLAFLSLLFLLSVFTVLPFVHDKLHTLAQCMRNKHTFFLFSSAEKEYSSLHEDENEFSILISLHHRAHSRARKLPEMSCHIHGKLNFEFHSHRVCTHFPFTRFVYISVFQFIIRHRTIHSHSVGCLFIQAFSLLSSLRTQISRRRRQ